MVTRETSPKPKNQKLYKAFTIAYGEVFERLYKDGDLNLIDTKDEDGNIIDEEIDIRIQKFVDSIVRHATKLRT